MKEVPIEISEISDGATDEDISLIKKRRYIAVFNREREKVDIR